MVPLLVSIVTATPPSDPAIRQTPAIRQACERAVAHDRPVLLAFTAPWCGDCQLLHRLERLPPLKDELAHWEKVELDVGRFDRHVDLLRAFRVDRIATWVALRPTDCSSSPPSWPRLARSTLEPASGEPRTPSSIAAWLRDARSAR